MLSIVRSIRRFFHRPPDFVIGGADSPYMRRWWVIPRNRFFNIYLHNIVRDDDDRALHDHPWWNLSIVLRGGYWEYVPISPLEPAGATIGSWRGVGSFVLRRPTAAHRLALMTGASCWSLFITGPNVRTWGFHCPKGWVPWQQFCAPGDSSQIGRGCE